MDAIPLRRRFKAFDEYSIFRVSHGFSYALRAGNMAMGTDVTGARMRSRHC